MHTSDSFGLRGATHGEDRRSEHQFIYVRLQARIPADHPLRQIRELVVAALQPLSRAFNRLYAPDGPPVDPPERLLRALATPQPSQRLLSDSCRSISANNNVSASS